MKKALFYLLFILPSVFSAQNPCSDASCITYLLATDPTNSTVASYLEKFDAHLWIVGGKNPDHHRFTYFTNQLMVNKYESDQDRRFLITSIVVKEPEILETLVTSLGYKMNYDDLRTTDSKKYPKVKKKSTATTIDIGCDAYGNIYNTSSNPQGDYSDCWHGELGFKKNATGQLIAHSLNIRLLEGAKDAAIGYNPVGWHEFDLVTQQKRTICETGDCVLCCPRCQSDNIRGVTIEKSTDGSRELVTFDVVNVDIPLPLDVSKNITYEELNNELGEYSGLPWNRPEEEKGIYHFAESDGLKYWFEDDQLTKITAPGNVLCEDYKTPEKRTAEVEIKKGAATPDSPGIVEYDDGIEHTYYGERKNGLPHGFGALTRPAIKTGDGERKAIYGNYFEAGRFVMSQKQTTAICLSGDCSESGTMLTSLGIYQGPTKAGVPHGIGTLHYTYDITWHNYIGVFANGFPSCDDGEIEFFDGGSYKGSIAYGKPNGNGRVYDRWDKVEEEGWYENGFRTGPKRVDPEPEATVVNAYTFKPDEEDWRTEFVPDIVRELNSIRDQEPFGSLGNNFYKGAYDCIKWDYKVTSVKFLEDQLLQNYRTFVWGKESLTLRLINTVWHELDVTLNKVYCGSDEVDDAMKNTRDSFEVVAYHVNNIENHINASREQLQVNAVQSDLGLAKQMYTTSIDSFRNYLHGIDGYYKEFLDQLKELEELIHENHCYWQGP
jgi:hypothetical protein